MSQDYLGHRKANSIIRGCKEKPSDSASCKKDEKDLNKCCGISPEENKKFCNHREKVNRSRKKRGKKPYKIRDKTWKDRH